MKAEDSTAVELSTSLPRKPALRSNGVATQPGGGKSVTFADSAEAELVVGPRQPTAVAALQSNGGGGRFQPGSKVTFADVLKSSSPARAGRCATRAARRPLQLALSCSPQGSVQGRSSWLQSLASRRGWRWWL